MRQRRGSRPGFALIITLWFLVLVGVIGLDWSIQGSNQRRASANLTHSIMARAAAETGLAYARSQLDRAMTRAQHPALSSQAETRLDPWHDPATVVPDSTGSYGVAVWRVQLTDAGTQINVNRASPEELRRFLVAVRIDAGRADRIAQSIADWRDSDDHYHARGAEKDWYVRMGRPVLPRNGPFIDLGELRHVREVTESVYSRIEPYLSIEGTARINVMSAPRPVLLSLPGLGGEAIRVIESRRRRGLTLRSIAELGPHLPPAAREQLSANLHELLERTTTRTQQVRVVSVGWLVDSPVRIRVEALLDAGIRGSALAYVKVEL